MRVTVKSVLFTAGLAAVNCLLGSDAIAQNENIYGLGIEGFRDQYKEPSLSVTDTTNYGSITGYFSHQLGRSFVAADARISNGSDDYSSPSGQESGVPQWEYELRARFGRTYAIWDGDISPYVGLGARYFVDEGKGYVTTLGAESYDRRIWQFYVPVGASYTYSTASGWSITPQAEGDFMFYGNVDTRLTNLVGTGIQFLNPAENTQHFGIGFRSELMFGKELGGFDVEIGPFIRYWHVNKSESITYNNLSGGSDITVWEPDNNRTQIGAALRLLW